MVSGDEVGNALTNLLDDACSLVPEDDRELGRMDALDDVEIGVANTARRHANEHLARLRRIELELLDDQRLPELVQDCRPNGHAGH